LNIKSILHSKINPALNIKKRLLAFLAKNSYKAKNEVFPFVSWRLGGKKHFAKQNKTPPLNPKNAFPSPRQKN
jgi:hypothetical protein